MKKFRSLCFLFLSVFFLYGCETISLNKQYTEFTTVDGVGYICEYIHGEKISCKKKEEIDNGKTEVVAFFW